MAHRLGEPPVIYDDELTGSSIEQLRTAMQNEGFFHAEIDTITQVKDRKLTISYDVHAGTPYTIHKYQCDIDNNALLNAATNSRRKHIKPGMRYSAQALDDERDRITKRMRNNGYYFFDKEYLYFEADSALYSQQVDVTMKLQNYIKEQADSLDQVIFRQYYISKVQFYMDMQDSEQSKDTVTSHEMYKGYDFYWRGRRLLRPGALIRQSEIRNGEIYRERNVTNTYNSLSALGPVRYVDIRFEPVARDSLICKIYLSRSKMNSISAEVEGTYSNADWGINGKVAYVNRNIFRGAEELSVSAGASYEWRSDGGRAIEARGEIGLSFPSHWQTKLLYSYQNRPEEFSRNIFNAGLYYTIPRKNRSRWTHSFNVLDISYIYLPYISDRFQKEILSRSSILKYSYQDHLIVGWGYSGSYSGKRSNRTETSYVNFGYQVETAGNALYGIFRAANLPANKDGVYEIIKVPFSQYARADVNFTFNQLLVENHRLVYHAGIGIAVPYLNSQSVPFEKRFFSGGANSVRGWQARTLGPGGYRGNDNLSSYDLQVGDIRLDLNLEYRWRVWSIIELAAFTDAGNNWTIQDYEAQPNGVFLWDTFYKQIAWSYGVGLRLDLNILLLRVDFGVKLYDPSRLYGSLAGTQWRTVANGLCWRDDMTFHFAIGYPF